MGKYTIRRHGTDSSGRPIYMTNYMARWYANVLKRPRVRPFADKVTIVQGAWMKKAGGGASASAGYHDGGGCLDFRTWNLTTTEVNHLIAAMRLEGAAAWRRDHRHGMDPHIHITLGGDKGMTSGAKNSWEQYLEGRNGLASWGRDYEWRPKPLRKFKYAKAKPKPIKQWGPVNVYRVNRALRGGKMDKGTKAQMNRIVWALRAQLGPQAAKGYRKHPRASLRRALKRFRKGPNQGMFSKGAGKRLKHLRNIVNRKVK